MIFNFFKSFSVESVRQTQLDYILRKIQENASLGYSAWISYDAFCSEVEDKLESLGFVVNDIEMDKYGKKITIKEVTW